MHRKRIMLRLVFAYCKDFNMVGEYQPVMELMG